MAQQESQQPDSEAASRTVNTELSVSSGIVVGADGSGTSQQAVQWAADEAVLRGCELHAVRAWTMSNAPRPSSWSFGYVPSLQDYEAAVTELLHRTWSDLADRVPGLHLHAIHGDPARILVEGSLGADLVVVGSRGHGRVAEFWLGSVAEQVVRAARCPVVVVRPSTSTPIGDV